MSRRNRLPHPRLRLLAALLFTFACDVQPLPAAPVDADEAPVVKPVIAHADLESLGTTDLDISGDLVFTPTADGVAVSGVIEGLDPSSFHAIHVHETGDCSAPDGSSAGPHFNPTGEQHGALAADDSHIGDLGNLTTSPEGTVSLDKVKVGATLSGEHGLVGRAVVVHARHDDLASQPSGDAGARIACGVIQHGAG